MRKKKARRTETVTAKVTKATKAKLERRARAGTTTVSTVINDKLKGL